MKYKKNLILLSLFLLVVLISACDEFEENVIALDDKDKAIMDCENKDRYLSADIRTSTFLGYPLDEDYFIMPTLYNVINIGGCYAELGAEYASIEVCDKILEKDVNLFCYAGIAKKRNDFSICGEKYDGFPCYNALYFLLDEEDCERIPKENHVGLCKEKVRTIQKKCSQLSKESFRVDCFYYSAISEKDPSYCEKISDKRVKDSCYAYLALHTGNKKYCSFVEEKDVCITIVKKRFLVQKFDRGKALQKKSEKLSEEEFFENIEDKSEEELLSGFEYCDKKIFAAKLRCEYKIYSSLFLNDHITNKEAYDFCAKKDFLRQPGQLRAQCILAMQKYESASVNIYNIAASFCAMNGSSSFQVECFNELLDHYGNEPDHLELVRETVKRCDFVTNGATNCARYVFDISENYNLDWTDLCQYAKNMRMKSKCEDKISERELKWSKK